MSEIEKACLLMLESGCHSDVSFIIDSLDDEAGNRSETL